MRHAVKGLSRYLPWLFLLLLADAGCVLILWIADISALKALSAVIVLCTLLLFGGVSVFLAGRDRRREKAFRAFLDDPDEYSEEVMVRLAGAAQAEMIRALGAKLRGERDAYKKLLARITDYEDYVEAWAHEIKTPISLLALMLDNRREELPEGVVRRLDHIRSGVQEFVNQMLYYARLKSAQRDYRFEEISLRECLEEVLEDYRPLLEEKEFSVTVEIPEAEVYSDRRGLRFILSQVVSNAVKYAAQDRKPELCAVFCREESRCLLTVRDNGIGVRETDLPFVFEKGFTGASGECRQKATGMGLYLAREIADKLKLSLEISSRWGEGFEMVIVFPVISPLQSTEGNFSYTKTSPCG